MPEFEEDSGGSGQIIVDRWSKGGALGQRAVREDLRRRHSRPRLEESEALRLARSRIISIPDRGNTLGKGPEMHSRKVRGLGWLEARRIKGRVARDED